MGLGILNDLIGMLAYKHFFMCLKHKVSSLNTVESWLP